MKGPHVPTQTETAPGFDLDAEKIVIGSLMTDTTIIDTIVEKLGHADFYNPRHADLYTAIVNAHDSGVPTEPVALGGYLSNHGVLNRLGGLEYLHECYASVPVAVQAGFYADRICELAIRRRLEVAGVRITQASQTAGLTTEQVAALAEDLIGKATPRRGDADMVQLGALLASGLDDIEHRNGHPTGLKTGFKDLDKRLNGLRPKQLVTIAAPTGSGKSVFLADIARHLAIRNKHTVAFFSLEMGRDEMFERIIAAEAGVRYDRIQRGGLDDNDWRKVSNVLGPMSIAPLFICDQPEITVRQMQAKAQHLSRQHGLDAVVVDYLQLVQPSRNYGNEQQEISDVSRALKVMAGTLDVPVICAAQMNRGPDMRADKLPQLSDLRGSGAIANNSSVVVFVHRPDYYDPESTRRGEADLLVRKCRHGEPGTTVVAAQLDKSRFVDMAID